MLLSRVREKIRVLEGKDPVPPGKMFPQKFLQAGTGGKPRKSGGPPGTQKPPEIVGPEASGGSHGVGKTKGIANFVGMGQKAGETCK